MSEWKLVKDHPIPKDRFVICISSFLSENCDWIFVGNLWNNALDICATKYGVVVGSVMFWHELPKPPLEIGYEDWISCLERPAPSYIDTSINFLLFDEILGVVEAEYWGRYQTDVMSCKYGYDKPLFWRPFPVLPIRSFNTLQI